MFAIRLAFIWLVLCGALAWPCAVAAAQPNVAAESADISAAGSGKQADAGPRPKSDVGEQHAGGQQDQPHAPDLSNSQGFVHEALRYPIERPCEYGEKKLDSDLCAQWYAAKGATDGAIYSLWGVFIGGISIILIVFSLIYARRGTNLAAAAVVAARDAIRIAELANGEAAKANELAADANQVSIADFNERMRPRCVVIGITLVEDWQGFIEAGSPVPMTIMVENLGGATGRHLLVQIDQIAFHDRTGRVVADLRQLLLLAPLRAGQVRPEPMLISHDALDGDVHGITVRGRIGSMGDRIDGADRELTMVEEFSWRENPLHRRSPDLVERAPGDDRGDGEYGLLPSAPASTRSI